MQNSPDSTDCSESSADDVIFTRADAVAGNVEAQFGLAVSLAVSGPQNYVEAAEWYFKAADQSHRMAQFNLGQMFAQGQGVSRNEETAVMWIRRAANGGDAGAQFNLGNRDSHTDAHGPTTDTSESRIESYKWFKLAAAQGYGQALERCDAATMRMTQEEVSEGNRRAVGFVKS
ncbi:MAG TPA: tetratricopeptide repeat protein [Candidatus Limnocylindria bacterium]|nr:tetratricopeptide repeat protein [Candidatus Limnocylindria bacterium]